MFLIKLISLLFFFSHSQFKRKSLENWIKITMYLRTLQKVQGNTYWEVNYASISKFFVFAPKISICFNSPFHEPLKGTC